MCVWHIKNIKMFLVFIDVLKNVFLTLTVKGLNSGTSKKNYFEEGEEDYCRK